MLNGKAKCSLLSSLVCKEALQPDFKIYAAQVKANAQALATTLIGMGIKVISGGTDTHLVLLDLSPQGLTGQLVEMALEDANITSNKNPVPFDTPKPAEWVGLRLGSSAATTRGMGEKEFAQLGHIIASIIYGVAGGGAEKALAEAREHCANLCAEFPI